MRPELEYASCVWNLYTQSNINEVEMVQYRAVRFVYNDYSRYSCVTTMIKSLGWDTLEQHRLLDQACMFYKNYNGYVDINFPLP